MIFFHRQEISTFQYLSSEWDAVKTIDVPDLSMREKFEVDRNHGEHGPDKVHENIGFYFDEDEEGSYRKLEQYFLYERYYPVFGRVLV